MELEFNFRTYNSFGPNDTLLLISKWCSPRLKASYGGSISTIVFEACCHNNFPPKVTLERMHSEFEDWLADLPYSEIDSRGTELRVCFEAPLYQHREVQRDSQVLAVKTFQNMISKASKTLSHIANPDPSFDILGVAKDLGELHAKAPQHLVDLVALYIDTKAET